MLKRIFTAISLFTLLTFAHASAFDMQIRKILCQQEEQEECFFLGEFESLPSQSVEEMVMLCKVLTPLEIDQIRDLCHSSTEEELIEANYSFFCHLVATE